MRKMKKVVSVIAAAAMAASLLAGCGGSGGSSTTAAETKAAETTAAAAETTAAEAAADTTAAPAAAENPVAGKKVAYIMLLPSATIFQMWKDSCASLCDALDVSLISSSVTVTSTSGRIPSVPAHPQDMTVCWSATAIRTVPMYFLRKSQSSIRI